METLNADTHGNAAMQRFSQVFVNSSTTGKDFLQFDSTVLNQSVNGWHRMVSEMVGAEDPWKDPMLACPLVGPLELPAWQRVFDKYEEEDQEDPEKGLKLFFAQMA